MHSPTLRKGSELSLTEKTDIFTRMSLSGTKEERDFMREYLAQQYGVTTGAITSLIAHETMRKMKSGEGVKGNFQTGMIDTNGIEGEGIDKIQTKIVQSFIQARVYAITTLSELTEEIRDDIREEFFDVIQENASNPRYDFYLDIEAISDYYNINPLILEQFLRNSYKWLGEKLDELKKGKPLTEEDKMNIRLYVADGENEKNKRVRRKEMALKYGVSIYVIGATTAWKIYNNDKKVLKKDDNQIKDSIIPEIIPEKIPEIPLMEFDNQISQISENGIGVEQAAFENDGGEQVFSEVDIGYIQELAPEYNLQDNVGRGAFLQHVFDLFPDTTVEDVKRILPDFPDDVIHSNPKRSGEGMGALMEYDNEIKNKWRQKLKEFIDENTDMAKRKDMKVLCLPGIECLEIPLYLELGFRPENIVGVESANANPKNLNPEDIEGLRKDAIDFGISFELTKKCIGEILSRKFINNASKYGIQTRIGMLEKVLETEDVVFDTVSLDFLGPISENTLNILSRIKCSTKTLVLLNYLAKREGTMSKNVISFGEYYRKLGSAPISKGYVPFILKSDIKIGDRDIAVPNLVEQHIGAFVRGTNYFDYSVGIPGKLTLQEISIEYNRLLQIGKLDQLSISPNLNTQAKYVIGYYRHLFGVNRKNSVLEYTKNVDYDAKK